MKNNKKGISTVVATVLIILITVAAVTIIWTAVVPMIKKNLESGSACLDAISSVSIEGTQGLTCKNSSDGNVKLQIARGAKDFTLEDIQVVISTAEGVSYSTDLIEDWDAISGSKVVPGRNEEKVYEITDMKYENATVIQIAPYVGSGSSKNLCDSSDDFVLVDCK